MNDLAVLITAYATALTAIATMVLAALTYLLALENKRLRKASTIPRVVPYLSAHADGNGAVNFVLHNVGLGPALNVSFRLINDAADFEAHDTSLRNDPERTATSLLPQGGTLSALFGVGYVLFGAGSNKQPKLKPFQVEVSYASLDGKTTTTVHTLDISQFSGLAGIVAKPTLVRVSESLEKIDRHLATMAGQTAAITQLADDTRLSDTHRRIRKAGQARKGNP